MFIFHAPFGYEVYCSRYRKHLFRVFTGLLKEHFPSIDYPRNSFLCSIWVCGILYVAGIESISQQKEPLLPTPILDTIYWFYRFMCSFFFRPLTNGFVACCVAAVLENGRLSLQDLTTLPLFTQGRHAIFMPATMLKGELHYLPTHVFSNPKTAWLLNTLLILRQFN